MGLALRLLGLNSSQFFVAIPNAVIRQRNIRYNSTSERSIGSIEFSQSADSATFSSAAAAASRQLIASICGIAGDGSSAMGGFPELFVMIQTTEYNSRSSTRSAVCSGLKGLVLIRKSGSHPPICVSSR